MKKKIKIGIAVLLLGVLLPIASLITFGPLDWPNNQSVNLPSFVLFFCIGLREETKTFGHLLTQYKQMFFTGFFLSAVIIAFAVNSKDHFFYYAALGFFCAVGITIGVMHVGNQSKKKHKAHSTT